MLAVFIFGAVCTGAALGSRYKVFVLLPAMLLASPASIIADIAIGYDARTIVAATLAMLTSMQLGYVAGCLVPRISSQRTKLRPAFHPRRQF